MTHALHLGDCLQILPTLADKSIDAIICDPPYGTTSCKWDAVIPLDAMWKECKRVIKPKGAIVLFGQQPFTTLLISSNLAWFRYSWVWVKNRVTGHANANKMPMKNTEDISVFYKELPTYKPQGLRPCVIDQRRKDKRYAGLERIKQHGGIQMLTGYPKTTIENISAEFKTVHPTQKPVALLEYLVKTYTNEGDTVLDFTMGSGTTIVACNNTNRHSIGIEKDAGYFEIAKNRIEQTLPISAEVAQCI